LKLCRKPAAGAAVPGEAMKMYCRSMAVCGPIAAAGQQFQNARKQTAVSKFNPAAKLVQEQQLHHMVSEYVD